MTCAIPHQHSSDLSATPADEVPHRLHKSNLGYKACVSVQTAHTATRDDSFRLSHSSLLVGKTLITFMVQHLITLLLGYHILLKQLCCYARVLKELDLSIIVSSVKT